MLPRETTQPNVLKNNLRRCRTDTRLCYKTHKLERNISFSLFSGNRESQAQISKNRLVFSDRGQYERSFLWEKRTTGTVMTLPWGLCRRQIDCACVQGPIWSQLHKNAYPSRWRRHAEIGDSEGLHLKDTSTINLVTN